MTDPLQKKHKVVRAWGPGHVLIFWPALVKAIDAYVIHTYVMHAQPDIMWKAERTESKYLFVSGSKTYPSGLLKGHRGAMTFIRKTLLENGADP